MRTITYFEQGDKVRLKDNWREWYKGDEAIVVDTSWEKGFGSNQFLTLHSEKNRKAMGDVNTIYAYMCELISPMIYFKCLEFDGVSTQEKQMKAKIINELDNGDVFAEYEKDGNIMLGWFSKSAYSKEPYQISQVKIRNIAVISLNALDFACYMTDFKMKPDKGSTQRKYIYGNDIYYCVSTIYHLHSLNIDEIIETERAKWNKYYDEIKKIAMYNLKPQ